MFLTLAAQSIAADDFTVCFEPRQLKANNHQGWIKYLWMVGVVIRYGVLFPLRLVILVTGVSVCISALIAFHLGGLIEWERFVFTLACQIWLFAYGAIVNHHGRKPNLCTPHIFVANHTSFNDFIILSSKDYPHGVVSQRHGGLFGLLMRWILEMYGSLTFNRSEQRDRIKVTERIRKHVSEGGFAPLLIFPEGTCVNNESTVLFHKGAFELNCTICPVAIKYNKRLSDPYWNTREQSFTQHIVYLLTRWMMVVDVHWLEPVSRYDNESAIEFADRVKSMISISAGLKNRSWNGYLKNVGRAMDRKRMHSTSQSKYAGYLKRVNQSSDSLGGLDDLKMGVDIRDKQDLYEQIREDEDQIVTNIPPSSKPITITRTRRHSVPDTSSSSSFPAWLSESVVIDARNKVLKEAEDSCPITKTGSLQDSLMKKLK